VKYRLIYTHRAIRDIDALDTSVKQRIGKTLLRYESDPLSHAEPLKQSELVHTDFGSATTVLCLTLKGMRS
jgi:hypothetical protein